MAPSIQTYRIRRATGAAARTDEWNGTVIGVGGTTAYHRAPRSTPTTIGGKSFAGVRDDPFFFDLPGFVQFKGELLKGNTTLGSPGGGAGTLLGGFTGTDTFAGTNVSSIALWVPDKYLGGTGRHIGIWATTSYASSTGWIQVDRMGRPAINTVFNGLHVPTTSTLNNAEKEAFNRLSPRSDRAVATDNVEAVLNAIGGVLTANGADRLHAGPGQRDREDPAPRRADLPGRQRRRVPERAEARRRRDQRRIRPADQRSGLVGWRRRQRLGLLRTPSRTSPRPTDRGPQWAGRRRPAHAISPDPDQQGPTMTTRTDLDAQTPPRADRRAPARRRSTRFAGRAALAVAMAVALAAGSQLIGSVTRSPAPAASSADSIVDTTGGLAGLTGDAANGPAPDELDVGAGSATANDADLARIRANVTFWGGRSRAHPNDFVSAQKLGESQIELARATGDLTAYLAADQALATALTIDPDLPAATAYRGVVFVALHRFVDARALAQGVLEGTPDDPTALATLGDASLELGDLEGARKAYTRLATVAPSAAASVRLGHLAFIAGDPTSAVRLARAAVRQADDEETRGRAGRVLPVPAGRHAPRDGRSPRRREPPTAMPSPTTRPRSWPTRVSAGPLPRTATSTARSRSSARRSRSFPSRTCSPGGPTSTSSGTPPATPTGRRRTGRPCSRSPSWPAPPATSTTGRCRSTWPTTGSTRSMPSTSRRTSWPCGRTSTATTRSPGRSTRPGDRPRPTTAMASALAFGTKDAKLLYHAGMIAADLGDPARARAAAAGGARSRPELRRAPGRPGPGDPRRHSR